MPLKHGMIINQGLKQSKAPKAMTSDHPLIGLNSAVYTGIKKPESFSHSGFSLKVARQLPLNTKKKNESKNPPPQRDFLKLRRNFTGFLPM